MAVSDIVYVCIDCNEASSEENKGMVCENCGGRLRGFGGPGVHGTRDSFGIKNEFITPEGNRVDTWGKWEKSGYRNPLETVKDKNVRAGIKRKMDKIKHDKKKGL